MNKATLLLPLSLLVLGGYAGTAHPAEQTHCLRHKLSQAMLGGCFVTYPNDLHADLHEKG
jgi:hypothetical protein